MSQNGVNKRKYPFPSDEEDRCDALCTSRHGNDRCRMYGKYMVEFNNIFKQKEIAFVCNNHRKTFYRQIKESGFYLHDGRVVLMRNV